MRTQFAMLNVILIVGILLFGYQNCSQDNDSRWSKKTDAQTASTASGTIAFGQSKVEQLKFYIDGQTEFQKSGKTFYVTEKKQYILNVETGVVSEQDQQGLLLNNYCLTSELKNEVSGIISSASVCHAQVPPDDVVCAEVITPAYAELVTDSSVIELGSATNSCGANSADLCGSQSDMLKGWIQAVKNQLGQLECQINQ